MPDWIAMPPSAIAVVITKTVGIYIALILLTRLAGIRSFSKMSGFDFAITVAIGSVVASTVLTKDPPLAQAVLVLIALFTVQMSLAWARKHSSLVEGLISNAPRIIMVQGQMIPDQMKLAKVTEKDLYAKLREANVLDFSQIEAVVAETTGDISVLHRGKNEQRLTPDLLKGVIGRELFPKS